MSGAAVSVLKELQESVAAVEEASAAQAKTETAARRAAAADRNAEARLQAAIEKRDTLAAAADLLESDWREWPWVREAKFAEKVPRKGVA